MSAPASACATASVQASTSPPPPGTAPDAAEVAHHGRKHAFEFLLPQHVQHRASGSSTRLAVVIGG